MKWLPSLAFPRSVMLILDNIFLSVDCWDGPDGDPLIYHGYTLTTQILFRDVLVDAIKPYAFYASEYPVILSLENHCNERQQETLARHLRDVLGGEPFLSESTLRITGLLDVIHLLVFQKLENVTFQKLDPVSETVCSLVFYKTG